MTYTIQQVTTEPAGRQLDTMIAKALGWHSIESTGSTKIQNTWLVINKLQQLYSNISLHAGNGWGLTCYNNIVHQPRLIGPYNAATAEHAICLTALASFIIDNETWQKQV